MNKPNVLVSLQVTRRGGRDNIILYSARGGAVSRKATQQYNTC